MLKDLEARARSLPREIAPPDDAWDAIKAEIQKPLHRSIQMPRAPGFWQHPAFLAAAALLLVAGSSLVTSSLIRSRAKREASTPYVESKSPRPEPGPSTFAEFASVENDYIGSVNQLSALLESEKTTLSPETVSKLKKSLEVIDAAILEARRALAADPANKELVEMLRASYNQKVDLLRRTTDMGRT